MAQIRSGIVEVAAPVRDRGEVFGSEVGALDEHESIGHWAIDISRHVLSIGAALIEHPGGVREIRSISEPVVDTLRAQSACARIVASKTAGDIHDSTVGARGESGFCAVSPCGG